MKSFVALSCLLVVASASANSYYYNSAFPRYGYQPAAPVAAPIRQVAAPAAVAAPVTGDFGFGDLSSLSSLMSFLPSPKAGAAALDKASKSLDNLSRGLPTALANLDPSIKADIEKVNVIIAEVCTKMMAEATPSEFSYYSPEGITASCRVINKFANDILLSLDDPSIIQSYVDKLQNMSRSLQALAAIY